MKYTFSCPLCKKSVTVEAASDDEALDMILAEGIVHAKEVHPGVPIPEPMLRNLIKKGMIKEE